MRGAVIPVPLKLSEAHAFVTAHHRHHRAPQGGRFAIGAAVGGDVVGVVIVGRPVARRSDDTWTAEVTRLCVLDAAPKGCCSFLYAAAWRACKAMGFRRLITYTLPEEGGASLRGAGWHLIGERGGGSWSCKARPRVDSHPLQTKLAWEKVAA